MHYRTVEGYPYIFPSLHTSKNHRHEFTMAEQREQALSETLAVVFIAILVIIATLLLIASLTGVMTKMLQKPALIVVQANQYNTTDGKHIISLFHQQGDPVILNGTSQSDGVSIISFSLIKPPPSNEVVGVRSSTFIQKSAWRAGDTIYIYYDGSSYLVSDTVPTVVTDLDSGTWTVKVIDNKVQVLLHTLPVTIK